jgi:hypothetical protein
MHHLSKSTIPHFVSELKLNSHYFHCIFTRARPPLNTPQNSILQDLEKTLSSLLWKGEKGALDLLALPVSEELEITHADDASVKEADSVYESSYHTLTGDRCLDFTDRKKVLTERRKDTNAAAAAAATCGSGGRASENFQSSSASVLMRRAGRGEGRGGGSFASADGIEYRERDDDMSALTHASRYGSPSSRTTRATAKAASSTSTVRDFESFMSSSAASATTGRASRKTQVLPITMTPMVVTPKSRFANTSAARQALAKTSSTRAHQRPLTPSRSVHANAVNGAPVVPNHNEAKDLKHQFLRKQSGSPGATTLYRPLNYQRYVLYVSIFRCFNVSIDRPKRNKTQLD